MYQRSLTIRLSIEYNTQMRYKDAVRYDIGEAVLRQPVYNCIHQLIRS